jgi:hypothetical protein
MGFQEGLRENQHGRWKVWWYNEMQNLFAVNEINITQETQRLDLHPNREITDIQARTPLQSADLTCKFPPFHFSSDIHLPKTDD